MYDKCHSINTVYLRLSFQNPKLIFKERVLCETILFMIRNSIKSILIFRYHLVSKCEMGSHKSTNNLKYMWLKLVLYIRSSNANFYHITPLRWYEEEMWFFFSIFFFYRSIIKKNISRWRYCFWAKSLVGFKGEDYIYGLERK